MRGKKGRNYNYNYATTLVASFFPLIIFILLCFNVLSTVPRENRLADFLYIHIYISLICIYVQKRCNLKIYTKCIYPLFSYQNETLLMR